MVGNGSHCELQPDSFPVPPSQNKSHLQEKGYLGLWLRAVLECHHSWERRRKAITDPSNLSHLSNKIVNPQKQGLQLYNTRILRFTYWTWGTGTGWRKGPCLEERQYYSQGPKRICKSIVFSKYKLNHYIREASIPITMETSLELNRTLGELEQLSEKVTLRNSSRRRRSKEKK